MKKLNFKKDVLPHLIAIGVFLLVVFMFFSPQMTGNKSISQHDVFQGRAAGHELSDYRKTTGEEGLWVNSMFSGMPGYLINVAYGDNVLNIIYKGLSMGIPSPANYCFISLLCFYILLLSFGVRPYLALCGALFFGLTTFNIISLVAGHNSKVHAIAYMPLVIAGIKLTFDRKLLLGFALTALALALEIKANHLQITYYLLIITVVFGAVELFHHLKKGKLPEFFKIIGILTLAATIALIANFGRLWTVYEYGKVSIRGKSELKIENQNQKKSGLERDYAFRYSNGIFEPMVLFIPNILGGATQQELDSDSNLGEALSANRIPAQQINQQLKSVPTYWGQQPATAPYYLGAIALFLFVLGIIFAEKKYVVWLVCMTIFGIMLSWGKNFESINYFLFDYLPGYNKFRSVTFAIIIPIFSIPLLGMIGLNNLLDKDFDKSVKKKFLIAFGVSGGLTLFVILISGFLNYIGNVDSNLGNLPNWFLEALRNDRKSLLRTDAFRSFIFIALSFSVVWLYLNKKISYLIFSAGLIVLVGLDIGLISKRFLNKDTFQRDAYGQFYKASEADKYILSDNKKQERVLYLLNPFNEAKPSYHHHSIGGYHGAKLRRYQDLITYNLEAEIQLAISNLRAGKSEFSGLNVINMLNTGYFIAGNERSAVIKNNSANGSAWFVRDLLKVNNPDEELVKTGTIDTKNQAVIDTSKFPLNETSFKTGGTITLTSKTPRSVKYTTNNSNEGLAVFSEVFYDGGWEAFIDDEKTDILRVNYVLRALKIPEGNHKIEFKFNPSSYKIGTIAGKAAGYFILIILLFTIFKNLKKAESIE